jgi:hypothetical protein
MDRANIGATVTSIPAAVGTVIKRAGLPFASTAMRDREVLFVLAAHAFLCLTKFGND